MTWEVPPSTNYDALTTVQAAILEQVEATDVKRLKTSLKSFLQSSPSAPPGSKVSSRRQATTNGGLNMSWYCRWWPTVLSNVGPLSYSFLMWLWVWVSFSRSSHLVWYCCRIGFGTHTGITFGVFIYLLCTVGMYSDTIFCEWSKPVDLQRFCLICRCILHDTCTGQAVQSWTVLVYLGLPHSLLALDVGTGCPRWLRLFMIARNSQVYSLEEQHEGHTMCSIRSYSPCLVPLNSKMVQGPVKLPPCICCCMAVMSLLTRSYNAHETRKNRATRI